jgi:hypothetical protein
MDFNYIENLIDKDLIDISNKDVSFKKTFQIVLINKMLIKKKISYFMAYISFIFNTIS